MFSMKMLVMPVARWSKFRCCCVLTISFAGKRDKSIRKKGRGFTVFNKESVLVNSDPPGLMVPENSALALTPILDLHYLIVH